LTLAGAGLGASVLLAACGGGAGGVVVGGSPSGTVTSEGALQLSMTDSPTCGYDSVNVTVQKVRVNQSSTAGDLDAGWSEIVLTPPKRVDLLTLTNGLLTDLGRTTLPAGHYSQMRLVLAANDAANPLANSVVPTGGSEVALSTLSGQQPGLTMNIDIAVAVAQMADFVLDFNACESVVPAGPSGSYLLNPVVSVIGRYFSGVLGYVDSSLSNSMTSVSAQQAGVVFKSTVPDSTGRFLLQPVAPGTYNVVMTAPGHATAIVTGVVIASGALTLLNTSSTGFGFEPPASASGTAAGVVTTAAAPVNATVDVLQTLSGGQTVQIARREVNATTGSYSYALATDAPVVAAFVAAPAALSFTADASASGTYALAAICAGVTKTSGPIAITADGTVTTNFSFP